MSWFDLRACLSIVGDPIKIDIKQDTFKKIKTNKLNFLKIFLCKIFFTKIKVSTSSANQKNKAIILWLTNTSKFVLSIKLKIKL